MSPTFAAPASRHPTHLAATRERTYIMIKPDGVQRGLIGKITGRFEEKGYKVRITVEFISVELISLSYLLLLANSRRHAFTVT